MLVRCDAPAAAEACGYVWPIAWLPMEAEKCAGLLRAARCPMCGNGPKLIFLASKDEAENWARSNGVPRVAGDAE